MRLRTGLSIGMVAATLLATSLYVVKQTTRTADPSPASTISVEAAAPQGLETEVGKLYCAERAGDGVTVSTGPDCAPDTHGARPMPPSITITREDGAVVITGADP